ncbi:uncharacterized protein LOC134949188 [Pseudophryne corroboree]|uniref:uncharacterized protein LOC134949188 n=1 Tax=Pseudophryne corroboree TaxID=495146 RepID=UPI0030818E10
MGNTSSGASQGPNQKKILKQKVVKASDVCAKSLLMQHVEEEQVLLGSMAEDIGEECIRHIPLEGASFESVECKSPPITHPDTNIKCQFIDVPTLEKRQEEKSFTGSEIPPSEMMVKKEDNIEGKKKAAGDPTFKDTAAKLPQVPTFPSVMLSHNSQMCTSRTLHKADDAATLLDGSRTVGEKDKAQTFVAKPSPALQVGITKVHPSIIPSMDIMGAETENIKREPADTSDLMKPSPREYQPFRMYQPKTKLPVATQLAPSTGFSYADILKHSLPVMPPQKLSDARPVGTQQKDASVVATRLRSLFRGEKMLTMQQTCTRGQETTSAEKQEGVQNTEIIKRAQFSNKFGGIYHRKSENLQEKMTTTNPKTEDTKQAPVDSNRPVSPLCFTYTGEKPKYDWISPPKMPQEYFTVSESCNREEKTQAFVPEHLDMLHRKDQEKVHDIITSRPRDLIPENFTDSSIRNPPEHRPGSFAGTDKQGVLSKTSPVSKQCKSTQEVTDCATTFSKLGAIPKKKVEAVLPQAKDLSTLKSASSKGHSIKQPRGQRKSPRKPPKDKAAPQTNIFPPQTGRIDQTLVKHQINVSDWNKPLPIDPHLTQIQTEESTNSKHSAQSLPVVKKAASDELTACTQTQTDNIILDEKTQDPAPAEPPPTIWKDFYVDTTCTKKCRCKHRPGKLPPNVTTWLSVSENRLAEPPGIITLKLASSLVVGTKLLLDHTASTVPRDSSTTQREQLK